MITSIFSKSKPINYIIVSILIVVAFVFKVYSDYYTPDFSYITNGIALVLVLFSVFMTDFIISKNELTKRNSYGIFLFGLSVLAFPEIFNNINFLIANLLILFALRRLFSLHTKRSVNKKFFDAVFWIALASLFHTWSILYLIVVVIALGHYWQNEGKYIAISILAIVTVFVLLVLYNIIFKDQFLPTSNFDFGFSFDFSNYNSPSKIVRFTIVIAIFIWSLVYYIKVSGEKNKKLQPIIGLLILSAFIALVIALFATNKTGNEAIFFIMPFSIIVANYIETIKEIWFREAFVGLLIALPILNLVL
ncbi:DUF6427 family protein [Winogradskyella litorisediminis]|uniref:DUF6427 family protein n=1 Tax=Winogradskyella litorisediminis TaxID=1156618 RepID=A0ABW3N7G8_9FLAO